MSDSTPSRGLGFALYGGTVAAALAGPVLSDRLARRLPAALAELIATGTLVGAGFGAVAAVERWRPFRREWNESDGSELTDLLHLVAGGSIGLIAGATIANPIRAAVSTTNAGAVLERLPLPVRLAISVTASDLFHTSLHRLVHRRPWLWRIHSVHHSSPRLYSFNASRFHALQAILVVAGDNFVLAVLGLDSRTMVAHRIARGIFGQIQHSNIAVDSGVFNTVLSTPEKHRWHHSTDLAEADTNYGSVVSLWDRWFGSDFLPDRAMDGDLGVPDLPDYPQDFRGQCAAPFRWAELHRPA